jgi:Tol biopolymer transport system component
MMELQSGSRRQLAQGIKDLCIPCFGDARLSPDSKWIALVRTDNRSGAYGAGIMIWPFRDNVLLNSEAILVSAHAADGVPAWSPDGNLLYFRSGRDRQACIWAQRLNPSSKKPLGDPFAVARLNRYRPVLSCRRRAAKAR